MERVASGEQAAVGGEVWRIVKTTTAMTAMTAAWQRGGTGWCLSDCCACCCSGQSRLKMLLWTVKTHVVILCPLLQANAHTLTPYAQAMQARAAQQRESDRKAALAVADSDPAPAGDPGISPTPY